MTAVRLAMGLVARGRDPLPEGREGHSAGPGAVAPCEARRWARGGEGPSGAWHLEATGGATPSIAKARCLSARRQEVGGVVATQCAERRGGEVASVTRALRCLVSMGGRVSNCGWGEGPVE